MFSKHDHLDIETKLTKFCTSSRYKAPILALAIEDKGNFLNPVTDGLQQRHRSLLVTCLEKCSAVRSEWSKDIRAEWESEGKQTNKQTLNMPLLSPDSPSTKYPKASTRVLRTSK